MKVTNLVAFIYFLSYAEQDRLEGCTMQRFTNQYFRDVRVGLKVDP